nr:hypothetical protein [Stutzerimonas azotifigens]
MSQLGGAQGLAAALGHHPCGGGVGVRQQHAAETRQQVARAAGRIGEDGADLLWEVGQASARV